jgi:hypothetical protein
MLSKPFGKRDAEILRTRLALLVVCTLFVTGCRRLPDRPEDLPELHPCTITVTFGEKAIEGVSVSLTSAEPGYKWKAGGTTDDKGVVRIKTAFAFPGAPAGKFNVSFSKMEERVGDTLEEMSPRSLIPLKYGPGKSEETVEVQPGKNNFSFTLDGGEEIFPVPKGAVPIPSKMRRKF